MSHLNFVRAAAGVLATACLVGGAFAQDAQPLQPEPLTMTDTAPMPASDRQSVGAVIMMDQPVLAQRALMRQAQERTSVDTRTLGAGPARVIRETFEQQRDQEVLPRERGTPK